MCPPGAATVGVSEDDNFTVELQSDQHDVLNVRLDGAQCSPRSKYRPRDRVQDVNSEGSSERG